MVGRHLQVRIPVTNRFDETALLRIAGHQDRSGFTAFEKAGARIEPKLSLSFLALDAMAPIAMLDQNWPDLHLEEVHRLLFARCGQNRRLRSQDGSRHQTGEMNANRPPSAETKVCCRSEILHCATIT